MDPPSNLPRRAGPEIMLARLLCAFALVMASGTGAAGDFRCPTARAESDRPDDREGAQIHAMYVLPSDGIDARLDVKGDICESVRAMNIWLSWQTRGKMLRLDTHGGALDTTFVRLDRADSDLAGYGRALRSEIESELSRRGHIVPNKLYAVYYGGGSDGVCGGGSFPPLLEGVVAAVYLRGTSQTGTTCRQSPYPSATSKLTYWDASMLHEIVHTLGFVPGCAPHGHSRSHVSDDPSDLMYSGPRPWNPTLLDSGNDDYFGHGVAGCPDLDDSEFLDWAPTPRELRVVGVRPSS